MKPFFKPVAVTALAVVTAVSIGACSKAAKTKDALIVGDWTQNGPIEMLQDGMTLAMTDSAITYDADGTSESRVTLTLKDLPDNMANYNVNGTGTWRIVDGKLLEKYTDLNVKSQSGTAQSVALAAQLQSIMTTVVESKSEIKMLTENFLIVHDPAAQLTMKFER